MVRKLSRSLGAPVSSVVYIFKVDNRDLKSSISKYFGFFCRDVIMMIKSLLWARNPCRHYLLFQKPYSTHLPGNVASFWAGMILWCLDVVSNSSTSGSRSCTISKKTCALSQNYILIFSIQFHVNGRKIASGSTSQVYYASGSTSQVYYASGSTSQVYYGSFLVSLPSRTIFHDRTIASGSTSRVYYASFLVSVPSRTIFPDRTIASGSTSQVYYASLLVSLPSRTIFHDSPFGFDTGGAFRRHFHAIEGEVENKPRK